ncbi:hypothetical protein [Bifidobacterium aquikefiricola]|uniref:Cobalamin biosynthesis protein CobW n=1 Tax=Bifidobacterium aquikefiricola TaxID=3059038 RepID=A0AB39U637_9BIFI
MEYSTQLMGMCALECPQPHDNGTHATEVSSTDEMLIVSYTARFDDQHELTVRRRIGTPSDMLFGTYLHNDTVALDNCCLSCTIKHDLYSWLSHECEEDIAPRIIVLLPKGLQAAPTEEYLKEMELVQEAFRPEGQRFQVESIVAVLDATTLKERLFDDAPFQQHDDSDGSGQNQTGISNDDGNDDDMDERCVGGALAEVIADANDVLLLPSLGDEQRDNELCRLVEALAPEGCHIRCGLPNATSESADMASGLLGDGSVESVDGEELLAHESLVGDIAWASIGQDVIGLSIRSHAPLHPSRLSDLLADKSVPMHIHGHFAVPNKPFSAFIWEGDPDGSIIETVDRGMIDEAQFETEILVVARIAQGNQSSEARSWINSFQSLLVTREEMQRPLMSWMEQTDTFTRWASMD